MNCPIDRRTMLQWLGIASSGAVVCRGNSDKSDLASRIDTTIQEFMSARNVPGGSVAIVKDNRLLHSNAYGWADREGQVAAKPTTLFRIASVSKPVTALGVMQLVEKNELALDARFFDLLNIEPFQQEGSTFDERIKSITVRQLLQHTGGWDRNASFDPMFSARDISETLDVKSPPSTYDIIRYMIGRPLDFEPGSRYSYSNFGYCILGRIIEKVSGSAYEKFVQEQVLKPCGIELMRLGRTLAKYRAENESCYYMADNSCGNSVFPELTGEVPWPYGPFCLESMDAHGGWLASAVDLAKLATALSNRAACPILKESTLAEMFSPPPAPMPEKPDRYYGCGWDIRQHKNISELTYDHSGSLPGTMSVLFHRWDGVSWVVLFNQRSEDDKLPDHDIERLMNVALDRVKVWPEANLFDV